MGLFCCPTFFIPAVYPYIYLSLKTHDMIPNTLNFDEQDFRTSAIEAVNYYFTGFSYPDKASFSPSEISHVTDIVASVFMTKYAYRIGGGFVQAVIDNNLSGAFSRADSTIVRALKIIVWANESGLVRKFKPEFETI